MRLPVYNEKIESPHSALSNALQINANKFNMTRTRQMARKTTSHDHCLALQFVITSMLHV